MRVVAIDPGSRASAFIVMADGRLVEHGHMRNEALLERLIAKNFGGEYITVLEGVESMGMAVGRSVFQTCFWSGRFAQASRPFTVIGRHAIKLHLCGKRTAKDRDIRAALIRRFGGPERAIGRKFSKGPLYGVSTHQWSALAVSVVFLDQVRKGAAHGEGTRHDEDAEEQTERPARRRGVA